MNNSIIKLCIVALMLSTVISCKKYLDTKPDQKLATPSTIKDLQALLDNAAFNRRGATSLIQTAADEYYVTYSDWQTIFDEARKNGYIWDANVNDYLDWFMFYENILYANTILDNWSKIVGGTPGAKENEVKGGALVYRAHSFWQIAQIYAPQYDAATADSDLGIVLRLNADFNQPSTRASVKETYDQIINDLETAVTLLPDITQYKTRPNKPAALALLARVYLQVGNYTKARDAANACLAIYNTLINYNDNTEINASSTEPFINKGINNKEVILYLNEDGSINVMSYMAKVDSTLYNSYDNNDLRKKVFFESNGNGTYYFKGTYNGIMTVGLFVGLATNEVYLIRAECNARLGSTQPAMDDLNLLLGKRYQTGTFTTLVAGSSGEALNLILRERKKELVYRGLRWPDIKRLNKEPSRAITLQRKLNGQTYTLPPNDPRYALLIPEEVMNYSNIPQNPR